jgi:hypothetical protein
MKYKVYIMVLFLGIISCNTNVSSNSASKTEGKDAYTNFVKEFYSWYLNKIYKTYKEFYFLPGYTKLTETAYIFNISPVIEKMRSSGYFSKNFIQNDSIKIADCNKEMLKYKWENEPEPEFNIQPCNFLWKDQIVGGQGENLDNFKIIETNIKNDSIAIVSIDIFEKEKRLYNAKVEVLKDGKDGYKINSIELEWVRYK